MTKTDIINKYKVFYDEIRELTKDDEIFPPLTDTQFEDFVSKRDWMGVPSFSITKKQMTNSDEGHIGIELYDDKVKLDLWFNATKAVNRFTNILKDVSKNEKDEFIQLIRNLDESYKIRVLYTEKFFSASADWENIIVLKCKDLSEENINELLIKINETKLKREMRQKMLPESDIATVAISIAEIEINKKDNAKIKEALLKLRDLTRITHGIKSDSQIRRMERAKKRKIKVKKCNGCGLTFPYDTFRTICPKCKFPIYKNNITKEEYDAKVKNNELYS